MKMAQNRDMSISFVIHQFQVLKRIKINQVLHIRLILIKRTSVQRLNCRNSRIRQLIYIGILALFGHKYGHKMFKIQK